MEDRKKEINELLKKAGIIKKETKTIVFNCNDGSISDWLTTDRYTK